MELIYSRNTALQYMHLPEVRSPEGAGITRASPELTDCVTSQQRLDEFLQDHPDAIFEGASKPLEVLGPRDSCGKRNEDIWPVKACGSLLDGDRGRADCFLQIAPDLYSVSPGVALVQAHRDLKALGIIWEAMQFCGTYAMPLDGSKAVYDRVPLTTADDLRAEVQSLGRMHGRKEVESSLSWVIDGSGSPMETFLYMQYCLPATLGGYAFPFRPTLNEVIELPPEIRAHAPHNSYRGDLNWAALQIILEYYGIENHFMTEEDMATTMVREADLREMHKKVLSAVWKQLKDPRRRENLARDLYRAAGLEWTVPDEVTRARQQLLFEALRAKIPGL